MELGALSWRFSAGHCCARRIQQSGRAQRCKREMHAVRASDNHSPESALSPLKCAQQMAAYRANQSITSNPVCHDMFAVGLLGNQGENSGLGKSQTMESSEAVYRRHIIATAFLDEQLLRLATMMNLDIQQGYQQIVLVGPGLDTRPFRLLWPEGTSMFEVAPRESHTFGAARVKDLKARVPPRCGFWRVICEIQAGEQMADPLQSAGFNSSKLSLWCLQGLVELGLGPHSFTQILGEISTIAAFGSLVFGHLPAMTQQQALDLLADVGLYGSTVPFGGSDARWDEEGQEKVETELPPDRPQEWLFVAKQQLRSDAQWDVYRAHAEAAEGTDEDEHLFFS